LTNVGAEIVPKSQQVADVLATGTKVGQTALVIRISCWDSLLINSELIDRFDTIDDDVVTVDDDVFIESTWIERPDIAEDLKRIVEFMTINQSVNKTVYAVIVPENQKEDVKFFNISIFKHGKRKRNRFKFCLNRGIWKCSNLITIP
jgi:hypothetical protein